MNSSNFDREVERYDLLGILKLYLQGCLVM